MPTPTYTYIAKTVLTGTSSEIEFANLGNYKDLVIHVGARGTDADIWVQMFLSFNNDSSNRNTSTMLGTSNLSQITDNTQTNGRIAYIPAANATAGSFGYAWIYIPDYQSTTLDKIAYGESAVFGVISSGNALTPLTSFNQNPNQNAITNIKLNLSAGSFAANSTFYLYGID
jgi:hypothetical protein